MRSKCIGIIKRYNSTINFENILKSNLGINPQVDGPLLRLPIPKLSEERRNELTKIASQYAENFKVSIRNIRRDFIDLKKREKKESQLFLL